MGIPPGDSDDLVLKTPAAAEFLGVSVRFLEQLRDGGEGPRFIRYNDGPTAPYFYTKGEFRRWRESETYASAAAQLAARWKKQDGGNGAG